MQKSIHFVFKGRVQGVGFRFTARDLAYRHKIKGWAKNLPDGRVEIIAQGENNNLNNFLNDLEEEFRGYIAKYDKKELSLSSECQDFQIKF